MKLQEFKKVIDKAYKKNKNARIEFWVELENETVECELESIGQYKILPYVTITIKPKENNKVYSSELSKEQLNYRKKYSKLVKKVEEIEEILRSEK